MRHKKEHVALTRCYFCNEADKILLARTYTHDGEPLHDLAPMQNKIIDMDPCTKCRGYMDKGVIFITIDNEKSEPGWNKAKMPNPYRTGGWFVVTDDAVRRMINEESLAAWALKHRFMFIEHDAAERLGMFAVKPVATE